jgi:hypothetical protein
MTIRTFGLDNVGAVTLRPLLEAAVPPGAPAVVSRIAH